MHVKVICTGAGWVWLVKVIIYRHQKGRGLGKEPGYEARLHGF